MTTLPLETVKGDLDAVVARVISDSEPVIVSTPTGASVVMMPLEEFSAWRETAYLLQSPANAAHLRKSLEEGRAGRTVARELDET